MTATAMFVASPSSFGGGNYCRSADHALRSLCNTQGQATGRVLGRLFSSGVLLAQYVARPPEHDSGHNLAALPGLLGPRLCFSHALDCSVTDISTDGS